MPRKNKSKKDSESCVYCGEHVSSNSTPPVQKSRKTKVQFQNRALSDGIRRRRFMAEKLANRATLNNPIKRRRALKRKQKKLVQWAIAASAEGDALMKTTSKLVEIPEKSEISPMCKGIIIGLMLRTGFNAELVSVEFRNMQSPDENPAQPSENQQSAGNLSLEAQHGSTAVIGNPSQNLEMSPGQSADETKVLTSIYTQTDSWSQLPNHGSISSRVMNKIEEPAPSVIDSVRSLSPIQEDDPVQKPDEDPAQKTEVCLNENESQMRDGDWNAGDSQPQ